MNELKLIVLDSIKEFGLEVDKYLKKANGTKSSYIMDVNSVRFNNGEGKVRIEETVRNKDVFILADIGNYGLTYKMRGQDVLIGPDEHFTDVKRCVSALSNFSSTIRVVTPLLYQSRQDKSSGRESLDCSMGLHELEDLEVNHLVTFDVHNKGVANALRKMAFENIYPTNIILEELLQKEGIYIDMAIAPDEGAMGRARYYAGKLRPAFMVNIGCFSKIRDENVIIDGKNPILEHVYLGPDVSGKTCIVVDDMIASGGTIIETAQLLREKGASKIILITTFALFTGGIGIFDEAYEKGSFDKLYTTNLSYIPNKYKEKEWLNVVNCSKFVAKIINGIHDGKSIEDIVDDKARIIELCNNIKDSVDRPKVLTLNNKIN